MTWYKPLSRRFHIISYSNILENIISKWDDIGLPKQRTRRILDVGEAITGYNEKCDKGGSLHIVNTNDQQQICSKTRILPKYIYQQDEIF